MIWELTAYNTDSRYQNDIRYREYTASKKKAEAFKKIPKIQFTDSGHGIVFSAWPHKGARKPNIYILKDYVKEHLEKAEITPPVKYKLSDKSKILLRIKELSPQAKEAMLLDLAWKANIPLVMRSLVSAEIKDGKEVIATEVSQLTKAIAKDGNLFILGKETTDGK